MTHFRCKAPTFQTGQAQYMKMSASEPKKRFYSNKKLEHLTHYELFFENEFFDQNPTKANINEFQKATSLKWKALKLYPKNVPSESDLLKKLKTKIEEHASILKETKAKKAQNFFKPKNSSKKTPTLQLQNPRKLHRLRPKKTHPQSK